MALPPQSSNGAHGPTPASSNGNTTPQSARMRPTLPHRNVTAETIEDAYVNFILYCNPAVSLDVDTAALRESFRSPPKSEGKSFSTFTLFELITKLHHKEIKTWAELALRLGVEPPDQDKGQSSQKIQQYAVRLKRWMHSMHVNAFFDYLLDNPHPYWTHVPTTPNPVCEDGRDGVAAEDDMALRALLPHIRPRRGRKRPEEDALSGSPAQRPRFDSPVYTTNGRQPPTSAVDPWTAHPDTRSAFAFPPVDPRSGVLPSTESAFPWTTDVSREPVSAYPQSAITPSTRGNFWPEPPEPRSAISPPNKGKPLNRRHGAKAVSSAWRSSGNPMGGKARGRPPMNRINEGPLSAYPDDSKTYPPVSFEPTSHPTAPVSYEHTTQASVPPPPVSIYPPTTQMMSQPGSMAIPAEQAPDQNMRPSRPGRLSLQVPERTGGPVRLATPPLPPPEPPVVTVNGRSPAGSRPAVPVLNDPAQQLDPSPGDYVTVFDRSSAMFTNPEDPRDGDKIVFDEDDQTNFGEIESLFVATMMEVECFDHKGEPGPSPDIDEAVALAKAIIQSLSEQALTREAFLINLSVLAGSTFFLSGKREIHRMEEAPDYTKYVCKWTLRYGSVSGNYSLSETVPHSSWKKGHRKEEQPIQTKDIPTDPQAAADFWQNKYLETAAKSKKNMMNLFGMRENTLSYFQHLSKAHEATRNL
ncbi:ARS binding protein 2-domain-containing protein [Xylariomycetidae sp. FL0641]|nr:ARS binding protein 2-domain-containing protein [Xylariomycetidae sp. FL0641]